MDLFTEIVCIFISLYTFFVLFYSFLFLSKFAWASPSGTIFIHPRLTAISSPGMATKEMEKVTTAQLRKKKGVNRS